jgi:aminoglycoside phosphotransferase (APT) family kinase protein
MESAASDILVDESVVRGLLREQHPDLAMLDIRATDHGWDNELFRLGDELVARLPRRRVAVPLIEHEQRWLPSIAERVSVSVPAPVRSGVASDAFPWPWTITAWFTGTLAARLPVDQRETLAAGLARFVRELHQPAPVDAPANPVRGVGLAERVPAIQDRLASGLVPRADEVEQVWERALAARPWSAAPLWLHGDLHPANILSREGGLSAVLDFGDLTSGDPATDLATAWLTFGPEGRAGFRAALVYDDDTWLRARGWALLLASAFLTNSASGPAMLAIGGHAIEQVLLDDA